MTKQELVEKVAEQEGIPKAKAQRIIELVGNTIRDEVAAGNTFTLVGVGTFKATKRQERTGRNPQDGTPIVIPAHTSVHFSAAKAFKDALN